MWTRSALFAAIAAAAAVLMSAGVSAADMKGAAYADLRYGLDHFEAKGAGATAGADDTTFENHGSYWGVKGSTSKGGLTAFGAYERWLDADVQAGVDLVRESYAGLATEYGTVQFGTFATAYMESGRKLDPFYATGAAGTGHLTGTFFGGQSHGQSFLSNDSAFGGGFVGNQLAYTSPTIFGLTGNVAVMFDEPSNTGTTTIARQDDYAAGLEWSGWGITGGAQYLDANSNIGNTGLPKRDSATRLYAAYAQDRFGANVSAERIDHKALGTPDASYLQANGWFGVLPSTRVAASYGMENETGSEGTSFRVGVFYDVLDNFTVNAVYRNFNAKQEVAHPAGQPDDQVISLGASYRFEIGASTTTH